MTKKNQEFGLSGKDKQEALPSPLSPQVFISKLYTHHTPVMNQSRHWPSVWKYITAIKSQIMQKSADHSKPRLSGSISTPKAKVHKSAKISNLKRSEGEKAADSW